VTSDTTSRTVFATSKVPEISALFWIIKVLTTGLGETTSDFFVKAFDPVVVVLIAAVLFAACLTIQLSTPRFVVWRYWLVVTMVSIFGTMVADVAHIVVGIPYLVSSVAFAIVLAVVFTTWWRTERTLSIHSITTRRRELFYWATVIVTFALGTATGDLTATTFGLGYLGSGILFAVLIALPGIAYRAVHLNAVVAFWIAYVLTRPLGASFADWLGVSHQRRGLDLGTGPVSLVAFALVVALVIVASLRERSRTRTVTQRVG
jgi:uncharacterized membrane-anchored protein